MIIAWIIGLLLCLLSIWFLKYSTIDKEPVLKMWKLILLILAGIIPILGIIAGLFVFLWFLIDWDIRFKCPKHKIFDFLSKPIQ